MGGREIERWRDNDVERSGHKHIRRELQIHALGAATGQAGSWAVGLGGWGWMPGLVEKANSVYSAEQELEID